MCNGRLKRRFWSTLLCCGMLLALGPPALASDEDSDSTVQEVVEEAANEEVELPDLAEEMAEFGGDSSVILNGQLQLSNTGADLLLTVEEALDVTATSAAIGNSASADLNDDVVLESIQEVTGTVEASMEITATNTVGNATGTAAAIGNSFSSVSQDTLESDILQDTSSDYVSSTLDLLEASAGGDVNMTGAAIANSASFEADGKLDADAEPVSYTHLPLPTILLV